MPLSDRDRHRTGAPGCGRRRFPLLRPLACAGGGGGQQIAVVGNPPFGFASSLAVKFFNIAAGCPQVSTIAFILPRTFRKQSIQDKLDAWFSLVHDCDIPPNSFLLDGKPYDVPCCWQVWARQSSERTVPGTPDVSRLIQYVRSQDDADLCIRRVGGRAGQILPGGEKYSPTSTLFVKLVHPDAERMLRAADLTRTRDSTAGVRSVSKREIAEALAALS